ncbi:hypothetical protein HDV00_004003 [Rhizophlyctis rosea]|nr:hypothetical protein HDV00_004003 [Rhizophlyctis rosea]
MTIKPKTAIILGAGPTGIVTGLILKNLNYNPVIYEIRPSPTVLGGAVNLSPNCLRVLDHLNLAERVIAQGWKCQTMVAQNHKGELLGHMEEGVEEKYGYPLLRVRRTKFLRVLLEAAEEKGLEIRYGMKAVGIQEDSSSVTVRFENGTTVSADILLGCDGIHSFTRTSHVAPSIQEVYTGFAGAFQFLDTTTTNAVPELPGDFVGTIGPEGLIGMARSGPNEIFWFATSEKPMKSREGWKESDPNGIKNDLLTKYGYWTSPIPEAIDMTSTEMFWYPIHRLDIDANPTYRWHTSRTLLLGDAAHAMPPHAGQGTAMGFEDAAILGRVIEKYPDLAPEEIFEKVYDMRAPRVRDVANEAKRRGDIRHAVGPWKSYVREWIIWGFLWFRDAKKAVDPLMVYDVYSVEI